MHRSQVHDDLGGGPRDGALECRAVTDVELVELRVLVNPGAMTARERVDERRPLSGRDEPLDQMAAEKAGSAGDEDAF